MKGYYHRPTRRIWIWEGCIGILCRACGKKEWVNYTELPPSSEFMGAMQAAHEKKCQTAWGPYSEWVTPPKDWVAVKDSRKK